MDWSRFLDPTVLVLLVPILGIAYWIAASVMKHRERLAMIEKGMNPDSVTTKED